VEPGFLAGASDHLDEMDLSDGVSEHEAGILAVATTPTMPVERKGDWWHSETIVDPGGKYAGDIRIHRKTGIITWERGQWTKPPYTKMKSHLRSFQKAIDKDD